MSRNKRLRWNARATSEDTAMLRQDVTQFTDVVMQASVLVSLWANGNLMETLYIVPRTAAGTKHSVLWEGNTLPPNAFKANISHSWCNLGCNELDVFWAKQFILKQTNHVLYQAAVFPEGKDWGKKKTQKTIFYWCNSSAWITLEMHWYDDYKLKCLKKNQQHRHNQKAFQISYTQQRWSSSNNWKQQSILPGEFFQSIGLMVQHHFHPSSRCPSTQIQVSVSLFAVLGGRSWVILLLSYFCTIRPLTPDLAPGHVDGIQTGGVDRHRLPDIWRILIPILDQTGRISHRLLLYCDRLFSVFCTHVWFSLQKTCLCVAVATRFKPASSGWLSTFGGWEIESDCFV